MGVAVTGSREVYGVGGFLPDRPNGNVIEQTVDNGDGTGTRTTFHPDGAVDTVEQLTGLPIPPPPEPDPMADMQAQLAAQQTLIDELLAALGGGGNG